ncbi:MULTISPECIES: hypothetical protein [unclassified Pseudomonas]|uniref:hypothetical protein n=1 Tax=unclassified Pseudomonas TaxID=196821 RepID=UPI0025F2EE8D|nr:MULTISPECIES: hypothetical protein [unclassified Pseudomonas]
MRSALSAQEVTHLSDAQTAVDVLAAHLMGLAIGAALIMSLTIAMAMALHGLGSV